MSNNSSYTSSTSKVLHSTSEVQTLPLMPQISTSGLSLEYIIVILFLIVWYSGLIFVIMYACVKIFAWCLRSICRTRVQIHDSGRNNFDIDEEFETISPTVSSCELKSRFTI